MGQRLKPYRKEDEKENFKFKQGGVAMEFSFPSGKITFQSILLMLLLGGVISLIGRYLLGAVFPELDNLSREGSGLGNFLKILLSLGLGYGIGFGVYGGGRIGKNRNPWIGIVIGRQVVRQTLIPFFVLVGILVSPKGSLAQQVKEEVLANVKVIRVVVDQSYREADKVTLPFFEVTKYILERYGGFRVVGKDSKTYDATLHIKAEGTPLGANYIGSFSGYHYSGAKIKGESLFSVKNETFKWTFLYILSPPTTISSSYRSPNDAPFKEVFDEVFYLHIMEVLSNLKGINPLISALKDSDWRVRMGAAYALGKIKDSRAVESLISALKDSEWRVREKAAKALGEIKDSRAVEPLISALKDESWWVRKAAAIALREINPKWMETEEAKRKVPEFISALKDKDSDVRWEAAETLGKIKDPRAVEPLISALKDESSDVRIAAAKVLGEIKDPRAVEPLITLLKDKGWLITLLKDKGLLEDKDWNVRQAAAYALGEIKDPRAVEPLISALKDVNSDVRIAAAKALGKIKDPRAVKPLISALKDSNSFVRREAAYALGKIKDPRAVKPLISALKDESSGVRREAAEALGEIKDPRAVKPLISALKDISLSEEAAKALGKINPKWMETEEAKRKVPEFISALKDSDWMVRQAAAYALGEIKDPRAVKPLISALNDSHWSVRQAAAEALGKIKDPRAVELLISALKDVNSDVRIAAAKVLGEIKDPRAVEPLISALKDSDWIVRQAAAEALKEITGKDFGEDQRKWQEWWEKSKGRLQK